MAENKENASEIRENTPDRQTSASAPRGEVATRSDGSVTISGRDRNVAISGRDGNVTISGRDGNVTIPAETIADTLFSLLDGAGQPVQLDGAGQIPPLTIGGQRMIPLKMWAERNGMTAASARQKALRGGFTTARKIGRDWMISEVEPNVDHRVRLTDHERLSLDGPVQISEVLHYLLLLDANTLPGTWQASNAHQKYCKTIFVSLREQMIGSERALFDLLCNAMESQPGADVLYISHEEIMANLSDEAWQTSNHGSSASSAVTIDFADYLVVLKNTALDLLRHTIELTVHHNTQTILMPWYHSFTWKQDPHDGVYFVPSTFFRAIFYGLT